MTRTAFAAVALAAAACCAAPQGLSAQTLQSIENAPGYRTVPESEPAAPGAIPGVPEGGSTFGDSTLVIQPPGGSSAAPGTTQPSGTQPGQQPAAPAISFTPRQLSAFAETAVQVQTVAQLWQPLIDDAVSSNEAVNLSQQANAEKIRAIEDLGLIQPETYARINEAARRDPELRAKIEGLYEAAAQRLPRGAS
ncbi:MAG TPA: DUF4168 domain-containing protein [Kiloniellaceae bacterium]|nr:DUF4168 domain-containing protein [Kiloniellaceae bacterium]